MSKDIVLYNLLERTFALLLGNENLGESCEFLVQKLDVRIQELRRCGINNNLFTSLSNLKGGFVSLRACFKKLTDDTAEAKEVPKQANASNEVSTHSGQNAETENPVREKTKQTNDLEDNDRLLPCPKDAKLQKELREIKESDKFKLAMKYFRQSNRFSGKVFEKENKREIKITAAKVCVISEILGNLTNLNAAADNCRKYISQLEHQEILNLYKFFSNLKNALQVHLFDYPEKEGSMVSIIHINVVVFRFIKEFTRKPVVMLDWPMIDGQNPTKYHPILGELPTEIDPPDPFTQITDINEDEVEIESSISAINCSGDIFAKEKASTDIVRIVPNCKKWYSLDDDSGNIVSIAIDCTDCKTSTESELGETSTQSSTVNPRLTRLVCRGKMYILARNKLKKDFQYILYVVDMNGNTQHCITLGYLRGSTTEVQHVKIFCISGQKLVILEFTSGATFVRICNNEGEVQEKIKMTAELRNPCVSSIAYNGEIVCSNGENMLIYNINEEGRIYEKPPSKPSEIEIKRTVQAVAYNQELGEFIILCYGYNIGARLKQYYLALYKELKNGGQLIQDIKLNNANDQYERAKLICHQNGPAVLLDNHKLLYLKR